MKRFFGLESEEGALRKLPNGRRSTVVSCWRSTVVSRGITLPVWNPGNPATVAAWRQAAIEFAAGARGNVRVLQGDAVRLDSIWRDEFRTLQANPNVNSIIMTNPDIGVEILLWSR